MDDDLKRHLPDPPPPRPAARRAALTAAMARFDGVAAPGEPQRAAPKRSRWLRPGWVGTLASIALVAVVSVPMALNHRDVPGGVARRPAAPATQPTRGIPTELPPSEPPSRRSAPAPVAAPPTAPAHPAGPASAPPAVPAPPAAPAMVAEAAPPPPQPPPPPPPLPVAPPPMAMAAAPSVATSEIVITGARVASRDTRARATGPGNQGCTPDAEDPADIALHDGLAALEKGDTRPAIAAFDRALAVRPTLAPAYLNRALAYRMRGDLARAEADIDQALRYERSARAYRIRSAIRASRGNAKGARKDSERADRIESGAGRR